MASTGARLEHPWIEQKDPSDGSVYWYNVATGEARWPEAADDSAVDASYSAAGGDVAGGDADESGTVAGEEERKGGGVDSGGGGRADVDGGGGSGVGLGGGGSGGASDASVESFKIAVVSSEDESAADGGDEASEGGEEDDHIGQSVLGASRSVSAVALPIPLAIDPTSTAAALGRATAMSLTVIGEYSSWLGAYAWQASSSAFEVSKPVLEEVYERSAPYVDSFISSAMSTAESLLANTKTAPPPVAAAVAGGGGAGSGEAQVVAPGGAPEATAGAAIAPVVDKFIAVAYAAGETLVNMVVEASSPAAQRQALADSGVEPPEAAPAREVEREEAKP